MSIVTTKLKSIKAECLFSLSVFLVNLHPLRAPGQLCSCSYIISVLNVNRSIKALCVRVSACCIECARKVPILVCSLASLYGLMFTVPAVQQEGSYYPLNLALLHL